MRVAIFGAKFNNDLTDFRNELAEILKKHARVTMDDSYFDSSRDDDISNPEETFLMVQRILYKADAVIIESTRRSDGIGLIVGLAHSLRKPTLLLYDKEVRKDTISAIAVASTTSKRAFAKRYTKDDLEEHLKTFLGDAKHLISSKFFIVLPPDIAKYLEWYASFYRLPKVERIRDLILEDMKRNKDWKDLLASNGD
jgi:hypothetical protein